VGDVADRTAAAYEDGCIQGRIQGREEAAQAIEADSGFDAKYEQAYAARIARAGLDASPLDGAIYSIWLHGDWRWLTRNMTTEQREAAAAAFRRYEATIDDDDLERIGDESLRWWR
jgi:hypothetical protein